MKQNSSGRRFAGVAAMLLLATLMPWQPAAAQNPTNLVLAERVAQVTITPQVADVGVPRTIQISGVWPGCSPVGARVIESGRLAPTTRVVQMILPQTLMPCPAAFLPYTASATFTPTSRGIDRLLIHNVDGEYLGESLLDTRAPDDRRSAYNITGMWYDPASNGSGLTFVHSRNAARDNTVFGTWYVYDSTGLPRWYTIQDTEWKEQGTVLEGTMYETRAFGNCPITFVACPTALGLAITAGRARVTLTGTASARVEALSPSGAVVFTSNVIRAEI